MPMKIPAILDHLRRQLIDDNGPGTILRDFQTLLDFVGTGGVRATGKYHLLPMDRLFDLDERLTNPLRPRLTRPQLRSFPHIMGLYLLLRATQIGVPQGQGKSTGMLVLDPAMLVAWQSLNPTERYFNLLEAWLRHAQWEMVGERSGGWLSSMAKRVREVWNNVPPEGLRFSGEKAKRGYLFSSVEGTCILALSELFGVMTIRREPPEEGESWRIAEIHHTPFGDAPLLNPNVDKITGVICGVRIEDIEHPLMRQIRYLDKLVDELAKGRPMTKILRPSA